MSDRRDFSVGVRSLGSVRSWSLGVAEGDDGGDGARRSE